MAENIDSDSDGPSAGGDSRALIGPLPPLLLLPPPGYSAGAPRSEAPMAATRAAGFLRRALRSASRFPRFDLTHAATIAIAVAFGVVLGSLGGAVFADLASSSKDADPVVALQESIRSLAVEVRSLKPAPDLAASLANAAQALAPADAVSPETTGSVAAAAPAVAPGWVLWRVKDGRALVHGDGGYYEVEAGSHIPGLGLVERIAREDGRWVVTTANGLIVAPRG